jgi:sigma-B regulation protein RsbU (phosphoserine phosphatase)
MSIMPQVDPQLEGFEVSGDCIPASEVGGDFFDYIWLNKKKTRFGVVIGDVSGKAMKSAMTAVMSSGILYSIAEENIPIKEVMTRVNRPMFVKTDRNMFTALCLVSLDTVSRELVFINAGLEHPMMKSGSSTAFVEGVGPRFPLGMVQDTAYEEKTVPLKGGDVWVFYTDGVSEAQNHANELYGAATLQNLLEKIDTAALSARQIKEEILAHVRQFVGNAPQHDDMTVVVVKVV